MSEKTKDYSVSFLDNKENVKLKVDLYYVMALLVLKTKNLSANDSDQEPDNEYEVVTFMDNCDVINECYLSDLFEERMASEPAYEKGNYVCVQHVTKSCEDIITITDSIFLMDNDSDSMSLIDNAAYLLSLETNKNLN